MDLRGSSMKTSIYFVIPDYDRPSWGIGMLYHHVAMLNKNGFQAKVLHEKSPFRLTWLALDVPVTHLNNVDFSCDHGDIMVIPEIFAGDERFLKQGARKVVFVQNAFLVLRHLPKVCRYEDLGFEHTLTYMPHLHAILRQHFTENTTDIPPFVAPYYYSDPVNASIRKKQIVLFPKTGSEDYAIVRKMLEKKLSNDSHSNWQMIELEDISHREVAEIMKKSEIFVSVNTHEAFNSSVPEAMAAGCVTLCYEAYGPKDFLLNGHNAYVFQNNDVYGLLDKLFYVLDHFEANGITFSEIRKNAYQTACQYNMRETESALVDFFKGFIKGDADEQRNVPIYE
jgi:hypothetical protein